MSQKKRKTTKSTARASLADLAAGKEPRAGSIGTSPGGGTKGTAGRLPGGASCLPEVGDEVIVS